MFLIKMNMADHNSMHKKVFCLFYRSLSRSPSSFICLFTLRMDCSIQNRLNWFVRFIEFVWAQNEVSIEFSLYRKLNFDERYFPCFKILPHFKLDIYVFYQLYNIIVIVLFYVEHWTLKTNKSMRFDWIKKLKLS